MQSYYVISCDDIYQDFYALLLSRLKAKSADLGIATESGRYCGRHYCKVDCAAVPKESVVALICDMFTEILLTDFKHIYFKSNLDIEISDSDLSSVFYSCVTLYDRDFDEELLSIRSVSDRELAIDSLIRFCTGDLSKRWKSVAQILKESFYGGNDREAIVEFVKHIVYAAPVKTAELNVFCRDCRYVFIDENGQDVATVSTECGSLGELACQMLYNMPSKVNFFDAPDTKGLRFLKNLFSDKVSFYVHE